MRTVLFMQPSVSCGFLVIILPSRHCFLFDLTANEPPTVFLGGPYCFSIPITGSSEIQLVRVHFGTNPFCLYTFDFTLWSFLIFTPPVGWRFFFYPIVLQLLSKSNCIPMINSPVATSSSLTLVIFSVFRPVLLRLGDEPSPNLGAWNYGYKPMPSLSERKFWYLSDASDSTLHPSTQSLWNKVISIPSALLAPRKYQ